MENLEKHYLILLTTEEQKMLKLFLQNSQQTNKPNLRHKPFELLRDKPYPVLDILLLQPPHILFHLKWPIIRTFEEFLKHVSTNGITANFLKFLIKIPEDILNEALQGEWREKFQMCLHDSQLNEELYLSLLSRKDKQLMFDILEYLKEAEWQYFRKPLGTKEFVLYHALKTKNHFIYPMIQEMREFKDIKDIVLRNNLIILKLVHEFSMTYQRLEQLPNIEQWLGLIDMENVEEDLKPVYSHFYKDFKRLKILLKYMEKFPDIFSNITVEEMLKAPTILEIINKHKLLNSYSEAKDFLESYYTWQQNMPMISIKDKELEILCYYYILSTIYDIITVGVVVPSEEFYNQKLKTLKSLLREIKNFELICEILEDVFKLIFIRWEHFNKDMQSRKHKQLGSSDTDTDDDILPDSSTKSSNGKANIPKSDLKNAKTGFICRSKAFATIFNFLKMYVTKKLHSADFKNSTSYTKRRFHSTVNYIVDLLWKYAFFEKMETSQNQVLCNNPYIHIEPECLVYFVHLHADAKDRISSDDDDIHHMNHYSLSRRKAAVKKRRRATFSGGPVSFTPQDVLTLQQRRVRANVLSSSVSCTEPLKQHAELKTICLPEITEDKSVIPMLLSSPERLAILALSHKQYDDAKQIIENFSLYNSQLNHELEFMEQQQYVKQKLSTFYDNYQKQEKQSCNSDKPLTTVEQIRNVAAKGFEVSKMISVIDHFAQIQRIRQTENVKDLINKHKQNPQYRFLNQFEEANLNAVIICDLILSLPFNRDITTSILMVIRRHQTIQSSFNDNECMTEKSQLPANIGPLHFLENLADCMGVLGGKSIKDLLCDNTYSLRPEKLLIELSREQIFLQIFHKTPRELSRCEDLKSLIPQFHSLKSKYSYYQRFCNYMQHLTTLVHLRDPRCEYHIEELLKIDPCDVIGELIFSCNLTPLEIEADVTSLNLNLVHVISLNICPEIVGKCFTKKVPITLDKESTILNYISNYNHLLVYLLQGINNGDRFSNDRNDGHINSCFLDRLLHMPDMERLSSLFGGNKVITALRSDNVNVKSLEQLKSKMEQLEILQIEMGIQEPRSVKSQRIDRLIIELIREDPRNMYLTSGIHDIAVRAKLIHENFTKIATTRLAKELIETTLQRHAKQMIPQELRQQLEATMADITIYAKVSEVMQFETWPQVYDFGLKTPTAIFERLLHLHLYKLCYEWCKVVKLSEHFIPQRKQFLDILLDALMQMGDEDHSPDYQLNAYEYLLQILETFHPDDCTNFLDLNKDKFRCMVLVKFAIEYLERCACGGKKNNFSNYKISILILEQLTPGIRKLFWDFLKYPLLIIEQLIMNAKFEVLTKVLASIRQELYRADNESTESRKLCSFCFDKKGYIYDISPSSPHNKARYQLGSLETSNASAFILLNFNLYQKDHFITNDCIDLILRIYATKALDYQISDTKSSSEPSTRSTDTHFSLDSLCGDFKMPSRAPTRSEWVRDEEATHCMCCRRAVFTMLTRRHHCRRCGRVVCFSCSTNRMRIPKLYADVEVRVCNDCHNLSEDNNQQEANSDLQSSQAIDVSNIPVLTRRNVEMRFKWKLSGNITHDKLVREEFGYDHSPSVALCLSILEYHLGKQKCVDLLLYHCRKLEKLIIPNPEVDYELIAKMMNCLALAAKVRGASAAFETIQEHSEIIISLVQNGCESLIPSESLVPSEPFKVQGPKKLADSLVQAERWDLALEVHLKYGFPTAGVMAAHGLSCIRAGCFDTAREKFNHCMPKLTNETMNSAISKVIFNAVKNASSDNVDSILGLPKDHDISVVKRPHNGPPLLQEILKLIESLPFRKPQPETLQRASIIRTSNTSLASLLSRRKEPYVKRMHEPALNILNTLANLKRISKGQYNGNGSSSPSKNNDPPIKRKQLFRKTRGFEECLYYTLTYGSHADVIRFLLNHQDLVATLKYFLLQKLDADIFINHIYLELLKRGKVAMLIKHLLEFDKHLLIWRSTLLQTCRYLETQNLFNSLYELQVLLNDPIRAAMTCVKFYTMNCENFQQQHANAQHLHNARLHLQSELETAQWENINFNMTKSTKNPSRRSSTSSTSASMSGSSFALQMEARSLNAHISSIVNQLEVSKFLANCEMENSTKDTLITDTYLKKIRIEPAKTLPTLFDKVPEKIQLCVLILLCGKNIDAGFGLTYRIIQHYKLPSVKVFATAAKYLARNQRLPEVEKLLNCITSNNGVDTRDIDEILVVAINSAVKNHEPETKTTLDILTKKIHSLEMRISSHIFIGQLKSAYLLANKYERLGDIRRILRQAEATNQLHIKKLCEKKLQMSLSGTSQK